MKLGILFTWLACYSIATSAAPMITIAEKPIFESLQELELDHDTSPPRPVRLKCYVYPKFVVVEISRPSLVGAEKIQVRPRESTDSNEILCARNFRGQNIKLDNAEGYFLGAVKNFAFVDCADTHGGSCYFEIFDTNNGKKLLSETYQTGQPAKLKAEGGGATLTFHKVLVSKAPGVCLPVKENVKCWNDILTENNVPQSMAYAAPDCSKLFAKDPELLKQNGTMFSVPVKFRLPKSKGPTFIKGEAVCDLNP